MKRSKIFAFVSVAGIAAAGAGFALAGPSSASVASSNGYDMNTQQFTISGSDFGSVAGREIFCDANGDTAVGGGVSVEDSAGDGRHFDIITSYPAITGSSGSKDSWQAVVETDTGQAGNSFTFNVYVVCKVA